MELNWYKTFNIRCKAFIQNYHMLQKSLSFTLLLLFVFQVHAQEKFTISGYITDKNTGEGLIAANVGELRSSKGTVTNTYGFYSLTVPGDSIFLSISYVGYQTQVIPLFLDKDMTLDFTLSDDTALETVEIVASKTEEQIEERTQMSTIRVPVSQLKKIPAFLGETDILKAIQLLPGVQSGGEGQSGFYVRGGSQDQNLILLDGTPVYNASHLFGFFSVFNADAIKDVTLIKGGFPARYGGRLSSVLDITMKEGNMKEFHGSGSIGIIASKLTLEGPLFKDKASFIVSARRTYIDILARPFIALAFSQEQGQSGSFGYFFYDFNGKLNWKISPKDRVYLSTYTGDDVFFTRLKSTFEGDVNDIEENVQIGFGWGNLTSTLRWNHLWTDKLFSNTAITYSRYRFSTDNGFSTEEFVGGELENSTDVGFGYVSGINDISAKIDFDYIPVPDHFIRFGANVTRHVFIPGENFFNFESVENGNQVFALDSIVGQDSTFALETYAYVEDDFEITDRLKANIGLHYSTFSVDERTYQSLQPRISVRYLFANKLSAKASFATMQQNIQFLTNENVGLPWDQWLPSTANVVPQTSWQVAAGLAKSIKGGYEVSLEGYYKKLNNVSAYREGASTFQGVDWQEQIVQGEGLSYGAEVFIQKKVGKLSGWIGYTLSWSWRRFNDKNFGEWYPFRFDRRHDISVVAIYELSKKWNISGTWVYGTGNSFTFPTSLSYYIQDFTGGSFPLQIDNVTERNNYRLAAFHRADVNVDYSWGKKRWKHKISMGAYNAYNRKNPFFLNPENEFELNAETGEFESRQVLRQYSLFRLIPSLTYSFNF